MSLIQLHALHGSRVSIGVAIVTQHQRELSRYRCSTVRPHKGQAKHHTLLNMTEC